MDRNWGIIYEKMGVLMEQCERQLEDEHLVDACLMNQSHTSGRRPFNSPEGLGARLLASGKSPANLTITERKSLHVLEILSDRAPALTEIPDSVKGGDHY